MWEPGNITQLLRLVQSRLQLSWSSFGTTNTVNHSHGPDWLKMTRRSQVVGIVCWSKLQIALSRAWNYNKMIWTAELSCLSQWWHYCVAGFDSVSTARLGTAHIEQQPCKAVGGLSLLPSCSGRGRWRVLFTFLLYLWHENLSYQNWYYLFVWTISII